MELGRRCAEPEGRPAPKENPYPQPQILSVSGQFLRCSYENDMRPLALLAVSALLLGGCAKKSDSDPFAKFGAPPTPGRYQLVVWEKMLVRIDTSTGTTETYLPQGDRVGWVKLPDSGPAR